MQTATLARPPAPPLMPPRAPRNIVGLSVRICMECFGLYARKRCDQKFCDGGCRRAWFQRIDSRKTELYHAAMAMRSGKKGAFSAMTNLADRYIREDAARKRDYAAACAAKGAEA